MKQNSTIAAALADDLAALGARRSFGFLGTVNFRMSHALVEASVELISTRHEGGAAANPTGTRSIFLRARGLDIVRDAYCVTRVIKRPGVGWTKIQ